MTHSSEIPRMFAVTMSPKYLGISRVEKLLFKNERHAMSGNKRCYIVYEKMSDAIIRFNRVNLNILQFYKRVT